MPPFDVAYYQTLEAAEKHAAYFQALLDDGYWAKTAAGFEEPTPGIVKAVTFDSFESWKTMMDGGES
tara:strand:+ start:244 stop:444 length:201 start_codon:yes stop_codon:yes gene_type:complete